MSNIDSTDLLIQIRSLQEELGKNLNAYFMNWDARNNGYDTIETYHPSEEQYYLDNAKKIVNNLFNSVLYSKTKVRTEYNNKAIFEKQIKPLLALKKYD